MKRLLLATIGALLVCSGCVSGVLTNNNNNARTGSYLEVQLNPSTVNASTLSTFGKVHTWPVEGQIYVQPLYVRGVWLRDISRHDVVYVATQRNFVYAFDANSFATLWEMNLGSGHRLSAVPWDASGCGKKNLFPWVGITSTPVIDLAGNAIYVVTTTGDTAAGSTVVTYRYQLHALDLATGHEKFGGPVDIEAPGFDPRMHLNRPGLLLSSGRVHVAFGSHCDKPPYHGWVFAYDARTLLQTGFLNTTPNGEKGGVWQAGRGLAADQAGNLYFVTGDGTVDFAQRNFGQSVVRLDGALHLTDWFTPGPKSWTDPNDYRCLNTYDLDFGSSGPLLILSPTGDLAKNRVLAGGKVGIFHLLNTMDLGGSDHFHALDEIIATNTPEWFGIPCHAFVKTGGTDTHHIHGGPVLWNRGGELLVYNWGENDPLKAFRIRNDKVVGPIAKSKMKAPPGMPGGILSVSHSDDPDSGLVWATLPLKKDASEDIVEGIFVAFQASPVACVGGGCDPDPSVLDLRLLWHSELNRIRDSIGLFAKFSPPTIADGKVFIASFGDPSYIDPYTRPGLLHLYSFCPCLER